MPNTLDIPECVFCHSQELKLFYSKSHGVLVECEECGFSSRAQNEHIDSNQISLLAS